MANILKKASILTRQVTEPVRQQVVKPLLNRDTLLGKTMGGSVIGAGNSLGQASEAAMSSGKLSDFTDTLSNNFSGNGANGQHSAKAAMDRFALSHPVPQLAGWTDMLNGAGGLRADLALKQAGSPLKADELVKGADLSFQDVVGGNAVGFDSMLPDAQKRFDAVKVDDRGLEALRSRALSTGPSAWSGLQHQRQALDESGALDTANKQSAGSAANAWSQMAMRGGVGGGGSGRLAKQAMNNQMMAAQGVRRQGMGDRLGIDVADENQRMDVLRQLPGMELARSGIDMDKARMLTGVQSDEQARRLGADQFNSDMTFKTNAANSSGRMAADQYNLGAATDLQKFNIGNRWDADKVNADNTRRTDEFNIGNTLKATDAKNAYNMDKYKTDMSVHAADKTATAMGKSGKK